VLCWDRTRHSSPLVAPTRSKTSLRRPSDSDGQLDGFVPRAADDYITKPFRLRELVARVDSAIRRREGARNPEHLANAFDTVEIGSLRIDFVGRMVEIDGAGIDLKRKEFDLLAYLLTVRGRPCTRDELMQKVWGADTSSNTKDYRTLDVHISRLRSKLDQPDAPSWIRTVPGVDYMFSDVGKRNLRRAGQANPYGASGGAD